MLKLRNLNNTRKIAHRVPFVLLIDHVPGVSVLPRYIAVVLVSARNDHFYPVIDLGVARKKLA